MHGWEITPKLPANNFEWIKDTSQFNEDFIKHYNQESDVGYFLQLDIQYPEKLHKLPNDLPFLPERIKIEKVEKLVINLHNKSEYAIHIRNLKQALYHGLMEKVHRKVKFNQDAWLKKQKIILRKIFSSWWIMQFSGKLQKMWKNSNIKL